MPEQTIDPRLSLPPGVVDFTYDKSEPDSDSSFESDADVVDAFVSTTDDGQSPFDETLMVPPNYINIVAQTPRVNSTGSVVVDVVIDVEDVQNAGSFEVRLTKA
jgi:hypothetical protein